MPAPPDAGAGARYAGRLGLALLVLLGGVLPYLLLSLLVSRHWGPLQRLDTSAEVAVHQVVLGAGWLRSAAFAATALGAAPCRIVVTVVVAAGLLLTARRRLALFLVVTVVGGTLANSGLKALVGRARPLFDDAIATEPSSSFPSGHTMGATVLAASLLLLAWPALGRRWRPLASLATVLVVAAVAASRVLLGVHYLSDVVGAVLAGLVWVALSAVAFLGWRADRGDRRPARSRPAWSPRSCPTVRPGARDGRTGSPARSRTPQVAQQRGLLRRSRRPRRPGRGPQPRASATTARTTCSHTGLIPSDLR